MRKLHTRIMTPAQKIFIGCILFSLLACGKEDYTPKKYMGLNGKVASIRDTLYDCTLQGFHQGYRDLIEVQTTDFDMEGNVVETTTYNADSSLVSINNFVYKDNVLFSSNGQMRIGEDNFTSTSELIAIENGIPRYKESNGTQQWTKEVKTAGKYRLEYSEGEYGYTKEETWADDDNNIIKTKYLLVNNEFKFLNGTNTLEKASAIKYDKDGNITETIYIENKDTIVTTYSHHQYDKYGNWTEERSESNGYFKKLTKRTIKYVED